MGVEKLQMIASAARTDGAVLVVGLYGGPYPDKGACFPCLASGLPIEELFF